jgi:hypothetical protein
MPLDMILTGQITMQTPGVCPPSLKLVVLDSMLQGGMAHGVVHTMGWKEFDSFGKDNIRTISQEAAGL